MIRRPVLALVLAIASTASAFGSPSNDGLSDTLLDVTINGKSAGDTELLALDKDGHLYATTDEFDAWRIALPSSKPLEHEGKTFYAVMDVPGTTIRVHTGSQSVDIVAPPEVFQRTSALREASEQMPPSAGPSFAAGYDVEAMRQAGEIFSQANLDLNSYVAHGVLSTQLLGYAGGGSTQFSRQSTTWSRDYIRSRATLSIGDGVSQGGSLGDSLPFAGVSYGTNVNMSPTISVRSMPIFNGVAANAANVRILDQGDAVLSSADVPQGPFSIAAPAYQDGEIDYDVVIKDATGRTYAITRSFYADSQLIAKGTSEYSYSTGAERQTYGSGSYGSLFGEALERYGVTPEFTVEGVAEEGDDHRELAGTGVWGIPHVGVITAGLGESYSSGAYHLASQLAYTYQDRHVSFSAFARQSPDDYQILGLGSGLASSSGVAVALTPQAALSLALQYAVSNVPNAFDTRTLTFDISRHVHGGVILFNIAHMAGTSSSNTVFVGFMRSLGGGASAEQSLSVTNGSLHPQIEQSGYVGASKDIRYDASVGDPDGRVYGLQMDALTNVNEIAFDSAGGSDGRGYANLHVRGGFGAVGGGLYAARSMAAPFALVEVGYPQVPVYRNNVLAGVTDKNGRLLVPMLAPYQVNTISIDPSSLPFGVTVETDKAFVPLPNTGRVVKFATLSLGAVTFHVVFTNGKPMPPGLELHNEMNGETTHVGSAGLVYVENVKPGKLSMRASGNFGSCEAHVQIPQHIMNVPDLGKIACE